MITLSLMGLMLLVFRPPLFNFYCTSQSDGVNVHGFSPFPDNTWGVFSR